MSGHKVPDKEVAGFEPADDAIPLDVGCQTRGVPWRLQHLEQLPAHQVVYSQEIGVVRLQLLSGGGGGGGGEKEETMLRYTARQSN